MKKNFIAIVLILNSLFFAVGCGKSEEAKTESVPVEMKNVSIMKVTKSSIEDFYEATGTIKAKTTTQIAANMMGRIVAFPLSEGDTVSRGQLLVEIDNSESRTQMQKAQGGLKEAEAALMEIDKSVEAANAGVRTAEANKQLAEVTFGRFKELFERKSASAQEFDEAQSKLKTSSSELERAKANVQTILSKKKQINARIEQSKAEIAGTKVYEGYSKIFSPVSGVLVKKFTETGAIASPGVPLLSIEDNSLYQLEAGVEESRLNLIKPGNRVQVKIDALGGNEFFGTVTEILPSADAASRTSTVKIALPANPQLKSGLYGLARFPTSQKEALTVPQTAIVQRGQLTGVFAVSTDGAARFRIVTTGKTSEGEVEILSGISEGDEIAVSDVEKLTDGVKVK